MSYAAQQMTFEDMLSEKKRIEQEISTLINESWINKDSRFHISQITLLKEELESFSPNSNPHFFEAKLEIRI